MEGNRWGVIVEVLISDMTNCNGEEANRPLVLMLVLATKWEIFELSHFYYVELDSLYRWIRSFISWGVFC
jgi:hypothetical protein